MGTSREGEGGMEKRWGMEVIGTKMMGRNGGGDRKGGDRKAVGRGRD